MAFIGNNVTTQGFTPAIDYFSGNGSTVTFTLSRPVASVAQVIIAIDNVVQNSSTAYSISGNAVTFTSAPLSGTNNIWVQYTSPITTYAAISQDPSVIGDITATGGFLSTGDFGNTYTDGTIVDYVTGMARITTGASDGLTIYNGGTTSRNALTTWTAAGNVGIGTTTPALTLNVKGPSSDYRTALFESASTNGPSVQIKGSKTYELRSTNSGASEGAGLFFIYDKDNESIRMQINSSGYVTTPYQPFFFGRLAAGATKAASWNLISNNYTDVVLNRGSCYNTSTGNFTCPVTGDYQVSVGGFISTAGDGARWAIMVRKNGTDYQMCGSQLADGDSPSPFNTLIVPCSAGDTLNALYMYSPGAISFSSGIYGWGLQVRLIG